MPAFTAIPPTAHAQIREANPATPRWEAPDIVLEDQLTLVAPRLMGDDEPLPAAAGDALRLE